MTDRELIELIAGGERPGVEFKNARGRKEKSFAEVVRAVLGLANRRNGGIVIIGVDDNGQAPGLTADQAGSWANPDHVRQAIAPFADPYVYVHVELVTIGIAGPFKDRVFAVVRVEEFEEVPVLCGKQALDGSGNVVLQPGACYVRPNHMPATTSVANHAQFRALLELAIEKGVRKFLRTAKAVGLPASTAAPDDTELFARQLKTFDE